MRIELDEIEPIEILPYLEITGKTNNNGQPIVKEVNLPIFLGKIIDIETNLDALIVVSDLQGMVQQGEDCKLLGETLPEFLKLLIEVELSEINLDNIGILICGDLYTNLNKRGSSGDVKVVWNKFNAIFKWVAGVAGNHDSFGEHYELQEFKKQKGIYLLHKEIISLDNIRIGGISGIIGNPEKPNRVEQTDYLSSLKQIIKKQPDFVLLHETPDYKELKLIGNSLIRETIENSLESKIFCGHCNWNKSLNQYKNGTQVLNCDSKAIILKISN